MLSLFRQENTATPLPRQRGRNCLRDFSQTRVKRARDFLSKSGISFFTDVGVGESIEEILKIKAECGKPTQNLFQQMADIEEGLHLLMCPVVVILSCSEPKFIQAVQITYVCTAPFACSDSTICLDNINGTEIIESHAFLSSDANISDTNVNLLFTITDAAGKIVVISRKVPLPISLYCIPVEAPSASKITFEIWTNKTCADLRDVFSGVLIVYFFYVQAIFGKTK